MSPVEKTEAPGARESVEYPPAPWELYGQAQMHLLVVPARALSALPRGFKLLTLAGHALVVAGWISYERGSVLRYSELFAAPVGLVDGRPAATVTHMWVDSEASLAGGRELWGYPKELAAFQLAISPEGFAEAADQGGPIASGEFRARWRAPARLKGRGGTAQPLDGRLLRIRAVFRATPVLGSGSFIPAPSGPLAHLCSARRLLSFGLRDFHFTFGVPR